MRKSLWSVSCVFAMCGCSGAPGDGRSEVRQALESEEESSPLLGFSLNGALPAEGGSADLEWDANPAGVEFSPSATTSRLDWALRLVDRSSPDFLIEEVDVSCDPERVDTNTNLCEDHIRANVILVLNTDDQSLREEILVEYRAYSLDLAEWTAADVPIDGFDGEFSMSPTNTDSEYADSLRLGVFGAVSDSRLSGELVGDVVTSQDGDKSGTGLVFNVARWSSMP